MFPPKSKRRRRKRRQAFHRVPRKLPRTRKRRSLEAGSSTGRLRARRGKSPERKQINQVSRSTVEHQVSRNLPDEGGKLESVTGETSAKKEVLISRVAIDDKIPIRREGVETNFCPQRSYRQARH